MFKTWMLNIFQAIPVTFWSHNACVSTYAYTCSHNAYTVYMYPSIWILNQVSKQRNHTYNFLIALNASNVSQHSLLNVKASWN